MKNHDLFDSESGQPARAGALSVLTVTVVQAPCIVCTLVAGVP